MEPDFPAAHSMDTYWFAVDARGQVAVFETGECGHVPQGEDNDVFEALYQLRFGAYDYQKHGGWDPESCAGRLGLTFYRYPDNYEYLLYPYERTVLPEVPLHVDMLPPDLRAKCSNDRFRRLRFDRAELLQPLEFVPCFAYDTDNAVAYLAPDGVTVRPVPGKEGRFADWLRQYREEEPEKAARLRFEGPAG